MAFYETLIIYRQDVSAGQVEAATDKYAEVLTADGAQISRREYWGLRTLAYRMKKNRKGHYVLLNHDANHASLVEMERQMGLDADVLRFMTTRTKVLETEPSVQSTASNKGE